MKSLHFAHRGSRGLNSGKIRYPENSYKAFTDSYSRGWDGVELDIQLTKDNKLVVFHDDTLKSHCLRNEHIRDCLHDEIINLTYTGFTENIFSFETFLRYFAEYPVYYEVKIAEDLFDDKEYIQDTIYIFLDTIKKYELNTHSFIASSCPMVTDICLNKRDELPRPYVISHDFYTPFMEDLARLDIQHSYPLWSIPFDVWEKLPAGVQQNLHNRLFIWGVPCQKVIELSHLPVRGIISDDCMEIDDIITMIS